MSLFEQPGFDFPSAPAARNTDGETSHAAARLPGRGKGKALVLNALIRRPATDEEIARRTGLEKGPCAKRRLDCQREGWVDHVVNSDGEPIKASTEAGTPAFVWQITEEGKRVWALIHREG